MGHLHYPRCETFIHWHSVDTHFQEGAGSMSLSLLPLKEANISVMTICYQSPIRLPNMQDRKSLMLRWCSFPGWGGERASPFLDFEGGQYIQKEQWHTIVDILWFTVRYLKVTMNTTTWNTEPEIGPDRSSQTRRNPWVHGYGWMFPLPRRSGSGCRTGLESNWPIFQLRPWAAGWSSVSVSNTNHTTLVSGGCQQYHGFIDFQGECSQFVSNWLTECILRRDLSCQLFYLLCCLKINQLWHCII